MLYRSTNTRPWIVALTGASGSVYGRRLIQALVESNPRQIVDVVVSEAALRVLAEEEKIVTSLRSVRSADLIGYDSPQVRIHNFKDIGAPIASGSYRVEGMVIIPCSMSTLAAVATGHGQNLIHRAADVVLKEKGRLILVPRETPLSTIHLENMLKLAQLGASITPAMPGFYHQPKEISELVDMMVMRVLDQMGLDISLAKRWNRGREHNTIHTGNVAPTLRSAG